MPPAPRRRQIACIAIAGPGAARRRQRDPCADTCGTLLLPPLVRVGSDGLDHHGVIFVLVAAARVARLPRAPVVHVVVQNANAAARCRCCRLLLAALLVAARAAAVAAHQVALQVLGARLRHGARRRGTACSGGRDAARRGQTAQKRRSGRSGRPWCAGRQAQGPDTRWRAAVWRRLNRTVPDEIQNAGRFLRPRVRVLPAARLRAPCGGRCGAELRGAAARRPALSVSRQTSQPCDSFSSRFIAAPCAMALDAASAAAALAPGTPARVPRGRSAQPRRGRRRCCCAGAARQPLGVSHEPLRPARPRARCG